MPDDVFARRVLPEKIEAAAVTGFCLNSGPPGNPFEGLPFFGDIGTGIYSRLAMYGMCRKLSA